METAPRELRTGEGEGRVLRFPVWVCERCAEQERLDRDARALAAAMEASRIPARWVGYSLRRTESPVRVESPETFRRRMQASDPPAIGITRWNLDAVRALQEWQPGRPGVYLVGPVGGGKSLLACAAAADRVRSLALSPPGVSGRRILYAAERELVQAVRERAVGRGTSDLVAEARAASLLVFDEVGAGESRSEWARDLVEDLVCDRYDRNAPVWCTANVRLEELRDAFGERVVSRLWDMVGGRQVEVRGWDWRTGQAHPARPVLSPGTPRPTVDVRARAAGERDTAREGTP